MCYPNTVGVRLGYSRTSIDQTPSAVTHHKAQDVRSTVHSRTPLQKLTRLSIAFAACALAACGGNDAPTAPAATHSLSANSAPAAADGGGRIMQDYSHNGPVGQFSYLPPMVQQKPSYNSGFDGNLSPEVQVCRLNGSTCVSGSPYARYTTNYGPGSETVRIQHDDDDNDSHYNVRLHTNQFNFDPSSNYRIQVVVGKSILGYEDVQFLHNGRVRSVQSGNYIDYDGDGQTLEVNCRIEQGTVGSLTLSPSTATITVGSTQQLTASLLDLHGNPVTGATVTWSSTNAALATVNQAGLVTAVKAGIDTIVATSQGQADTAVVTIKAALSVASVSPHCQLGLGPARQAAAVGGCARRLIGKSNHRGRGYLDQ